MPGIAFDGSEDLPNDLDPHLSLTGAALMNDQMQYIVIEGRKPQDGAKPAQALLILPKWISPTLACAGIVGRVIELTDGNIIEQGAVFMGEQETLESLRIDIRQDSESQQEEVSPTAIDPRATQPQGGLSDADIDAIAESMPGGVLGFMKDWGYHQFAREVQNRTTPDTAYKQGENTSLDDAYREGMQAVRTAMVKRFTAHGMPEGAGVGEWFTAQMEELERQRNAALPVKLNALLLEFGGAELGDTWQEWLREQLEELAELRSMIGATQAQVTSGNLLLGNYKAKLQAAEDNLDAWRDAAGAAGLGQECDLQTGQIKRLFVTPDLPVEVQALPAKGQAHSKSLQLANNRYYNLQRAIAEVMIAGQDYIDKGGLAE